MTPEKPSAQTQGARQTGAALGCVLAGVFAAMPVRADLPPSIEVILRACLDAGQTPAARVASAYAAGWTDLSQDMHLDAARSLAPWDILRRFGVDRFDALGPENLPDELELAAESSARIIAENISGDHWFTLPEGAGFARIVDVLGDGNGAECAISAEIVAEDVASALQLAPRVVERETIALTLFDLASGPEDRGAIVSHLRLVGDAQSRHPILLTPRIPRPTPRAATAQ